LCFLIGAITGAISTSAVRPTGNESSEAERVNSEVTELITDAAGGIGSGIDRLEGIRSELEDSIIALEELRILNRGSSDILAQLRAEIILLETTIVNLRELVGGVNCRADNTIKNAPTTATDF
jgi:hypothetical protein